jgi:hypothetical protein
MKTRLLVRFRPTSAPNTSMLTTPRALAHWTSTSTCCPPDTRPRRSCRSSCTNRCRSSPSLPRLRSRGSFQGRQSHHQSPGRPERPGLPPPAFRGRTSCIDHGCCEDTRPATPRIALEGAKKVWCGKLVVPIATRRSVLQDRVVRHKVRATQCPRPTQGRCAPELVHAAALAAVPRGPATRIQAGDRGVPSTPRHIRGS